MYVERLHLEVTRNCTLNCEHCFRGDKEIVNMDPALLDYIFKDVKRVDKLLLTGGEPLLAIAVIERLIEILKTKTVEIGSVEIITNGTVFSGRILKALLQLSTLSSLDFRVSYDIFHELELERLNLKDKRDRNVEMMKEHLKVVEYGKDMFDFIRRGLIAKGRATALSPERLQEINNLVYAKFHVMEDYGNSEPAPEYLYWMDRVNGAISVDVLGRLVEYGSSFKEEDIFSEENNLDIKIIGFRDAVMGLIERLKASEKYQHILWF